MKATLEPINSVSQAVTVEVPATTVEQCRQKILKKIADDAKLPGFRKGKVPLEMVEKRVGKDVDRDIVEEVVRQTYPDALRQVGGRPISDPRIDAKPLLAGAPFSYKAIFEIFPEVKVEKYDGLKLSRDKIEVSADDVARELGILRQRMTQLEPAPEGELMEGMMALVDFAGTADGRSFEGSKAENFVVDFGSGNLLADFEAEVRGMKSGEKRSITFRYPADYFNKQVAGKEGKFEVTVKEVRRKLIPELDHEFAKSFGNFDTLQALEKDMKQRIHAHKDEHERRKLHRQIIEQLAGQQAIEVPEVMVHAELSSMLEQLDRELKAQGQTLEKAGVDIQAFVKTNYGEALLRTRGFLLVHAIAKQGGLAVTDEEKSARIKALASQAGESEANIRSYLDKEGRMGRLETELLLEKTLDFILGKSKIKEVKAKNEKK